MKVREVMNQPAVTCRPEDTLNTAAQLMWERDCGAIPVVNEDGALVGMLTDRDICMAAYTQGTALSAIPVQNAMARQIFTCHADNSLRDAEQLMSEKQIRRLPVVDGDERIIGVISLNDIARYAASARPGDSFERDLTNTFAAICEPRPHALQRIEPTAARA